jgi:NAD-dependent deacetylase
MEKRPKLVVLSGAGISRESGVATFRGAGGLWNGYAVEEVATPQAFAANPELVLDFYNQRRRQLHEVEPNAGHRALAELETYFDVYVVTQNVDDLHERAGSSKILHLHGELKKVRSTIAPDYVLDWEGDLNLGQLCPKGGQLRPHIVWFSEPVPQMDNAYKWVSAADILIVVGTSLQVYPAAFLAHDVRPGIPCFLVDPDPNVKVSGFKHIQAGAAAGLPALAERLKQQYGFA